MSIDIFDFTKKTQKNKIQSNIVQVDHEEGMVVIPKGTEFPEGAEVPIVGPTSGNAYKELKISEEKKREINKRLIALMGEWFQCIQCRQMMRGMDPETRVSVKVSRFRLGNSGPETLNITCPMCDAPMVKLDRTPDGAE